MTAFPPAIERYKVTDSAPSRDLLVLGRFYSEAGGYASSIFDKAHQSFAKKCRRRFEKVVDALIDREVISDPDELWGRPEGEFDISDLPSLTIDQLETQYFLCVSAHDRRRSAGREGHTYFQEARIVKELSCRQPADKSDKIRMECCRGLYRDDLEGLSSTIRKPEKNPGDVNVFKTDQVYTPQQLVALIRLYGCFNSVAERETLVQYIDKALDLIEGADVPDELLGLVTVLTAPRCRTNVRIPEWIYPLILGVLKRWTRRRHLPETEIVIPMLAYAMHTSEWEWQRKAGRIINRCYRNVLALDAGDSTLHEDIERLYVASVCSDFINRFQYPKIAAAWNVISEKALASDTETSTLHYYKLLEVAASVKKYANVSEELETSLRQALQSLAASGDVEAVAYAEVLSRRARLA